MPTPCSRSIRSPCSRIVSIIRRCRGRCQRMTIRWMKRTLSFQSSEDVGGDANMGHRVPSLTGTSKVSIIRRCRGRCQLMSPMTRHTLATRFQSSEDVGGDANKSSMAGHFGRRRVSIIRRCRGRCQHSQSRRRSRGPEGFNHPKM